MNKNRNSDFLQIRQCWMFEVHQFLFRLNWPLFRPAATLAPEAQFSQQKWRNEISLCVSIYRGIFIASPVKLTLQEKKSMTSRILTSPLQYLNCSKTLPFGLCPQN
jgi:hypothetical protein